jgi:hypothetical protein
MIELFIVGGLASAGVTAVHAIREHRTAATRRQLQNIEFDRLLKSQEIHHTVSQARKQMVEEAHRARH